MALVALLDFPIWAQDREPDGKLSPALDLRDDPEIIQRVRSRSYPGGSDESDLKVQSQLTKPTRKISPTVEDESEPVSQD